MVSAATSTIEITSAIIGIAIEVRLKIIFDNGRLSILSSYIERARDAERRNERTELKGADTILVGDVHGTTLHACKSRFTSHSTLIVHK